MYNIQYTIYNIQYTMYNIWYTIYNIQYKIKNTQYTIYNIQYTCTMKTKKLSNRKTTLNQYFKCILFCYKAIVYVLLDFLKLIVIPWV